MHVDFNRKARKVFYMGSFIKRKVRKAYTFKLCELCEKS